MLDKGVAAIKKHMVKAEFQNDFKFGLNFDSRA